MTYEPKNFTKTFLVKKGTNKLTIKLYPAYGGRAVYNKGSGEYENNTVEGVKIFAQKIIKRISVDNTINSALLDYPWSQFSAKFKFDLINEIENNYSNLQYFSELRDYLLDTL